MHCIFLYYYNITRCMFATNPVLLCHFCCFYNKTKMILDHVTELRTAKARISELENAAVLHRTEVSWILNMPRLTNRSLVLSCPVLESQLQITWQSISDWLAGKLKFMHITYLLLLVSVLILIALLGVQIACCSF